MTSLVAPLRFLHLYSSSRHAFQSWPLGVLASLLLSPLVGPEVLAQSALSVKATEPESLIENKHTPFRGMPIPAERVQQMVGDLLALEERFELTLASAGVLLQPQSSMTTWVKKLQLEEGEQAEAVAAPARYAGTLRALNQAKQHRLDFQAQIQQANYLQASQIWLKAKNLLTDHFPTNQSDVMPQIRAMWLDRGTIVETQSQDALKQLFDQLQRAGINVVFFETVNAGYPLYPSDVAPQQNPLIQDWDPLQAAIALAHEREMELHAWVWVFAGANQHHNKIVGLPQDYPGPLLDKHPAWAITDRHGKRPEWISGKSFLDPANPEVRDYLQQLFSEIVTRYDVDGLQLDYIRYPFQNPSQGNIHGYSFEARRQFQQRYQVDPIQVTPGHRHWRHWLNFKAEKIDSFVQETSERLKAKKPDLILSAAVFPMDAQVRHQNLHQNWQRWVQSGWVDLLAPMTYASNAKMFQGLTEPLFEEEFQGNALMIPGLQLLNMPSHKTLEQVHFVQRSPTLGYALFAAAHFRSSLASHLNRPPLKAQAVLPHRAPLQSAAIAYAGLKREWQYWLGRHASELSESTDSLDSWAETVDQVSLAFEQLLKDPTLMQLDQTVTTLEALQSSGGLATLSPQLSDQHAERWGHRLQKIQRLLTYGKRQAAAFNQSATPSESGE